MHKMENLLLTQSRRDTTPVKLSNLSPQKYGKAAFDQNRCYTPSKLADNVLFRQVTTLKKVQQGNGKLRQYQALHSLLKQRLAQLQQERDGIQKSLNQQIAMYKKMLNQKQQNNQIRIKEIQKKFREQIRIIIQEKQEEAKYYQSQKQLLENRIYQLEDLVNELNNRLSNQGGAYNDLKNQMEKTQIKLKNSQQYATKLQKDKTIQTQKAEARYKDLSDDYKQAKINWKKQLQQILNKKQQEKMILQSTLKHQIEELQNARMMESCQLNQQIRKLNEVLQAQQRNFQSNSQLKEQIIQKLNREISQSKKAMLNLKQRYEDELNKVCYDNNKFQDDLESLNSQNQHLVRQLKECEQLFTRQKLFMSQHIQKLKEQLSFNQINYVREKDKNQFVSIDLQKQLRRLSAENKHLLHQSSQKQLLARELSQLRELLMESSRQIQACKQRFISFELENNQLRSQIQRFIYQNESLQRIRKELEQEALKWRKNYLRLAQ